MADVRAMLRAEKASRSKKRKAANDSPIQAEKRARANDDAPPDPPSVETQTPHRQAPAEDGQVRDSPKPTDDPQPPPRAADDQPASLPAEAPPDDAVDEAEWAAFERDVATPDPPANSVSALEAIKASAIQAEPMTAAEIEARGRAEEQRRERDRREAEAEADREEAAQRLEDELEQMEALERRIQRLKELREELRRKPADDDDDDDEEEDLLHATAAGGATDAEEPDGVESDELEDVDDDWHNGFR